MLSGTLYDNSSYNVLGKNTYLINKYYSISGGYIDISSSMNNDISNIFPSFHNFQVQYLMTFTEDAKPLIGKTINAIYTGDALFSSHYSQVLADSSFDTIIIGLMHIDGE